MSLFTIADLHLSLSEKTNKPMDVFGYRWKNYTEKIEKNWRAVVTERDTVVVPGDISWAMRLEEAKEDFAFINSLPGRKIIGKGNHDLWWQSMKKLREFTGANGFDSIDFLFNNCYESQHYILCGSRGWWMDSNADALPENTDFDLVVARECGRLRASFTAGQQLQKVHPEKELLAFLHFPVCFAGRCCPELLAVFAEFGVTRCYYGHIHGNYDLPATTEEGGVRFTLVSADFLNFIPLCIDIC